MCDSSSPHPALQYGDVQAVSVMMILVQCDSKWMLVTMKRCRAGGAVLFSCLIAAVLAFVFDIGGRN